MSDTFQGFFVALERLATRSRFLRIIMALALGMITEGVAGCFRFVAHMMYQLSSEFVLRAEVHSSIMYALRHTLADTTIPFFVILAIFCFGVYAISRATDAVLKHKGQLAFAIISMILTGLIAEHYHARHQFDDCPPSSQSSSLPY
jgi:hypothetical protein